MGLDYAYVAVTKTADGLMVGQATCKDADRHTQETQDTAISLRPNTFFLQVKVSEGGICRFGISTDGSAFTTLAEPFTARKAKWIGPKVGLFATRTAKVNESGYADIDWFRVE
jgi:hypothetical protein